MTETNRARRTTSGTARAATAGRYVSKTGRMSARNRRLAATFVKEANKQLGRKSPDWVDEAGA